MVWKTTVVLIASGLTGSGIFALKRSEEPQLAAVAPSPETLQREQIQASFAARHPFACFTHVSR